MDTMRLFLVAWLLLAEAMLNKNKRPYDPSSLASEQRLFANLRDLYASNTVSAQRAQEIVNDVASAAPGLRSFGKLKNNKKANVARTLRNKFLKGVLWPKSYQAWIRVYNLKKGVEEQQLCSFMLPHETLAALDAAGHRDVLMDRAGLDPLSLEHLQKCERSSGHQLLALGVWGDGVPVNYDRSESVETFSLNLPGQSGVYKTLRLPITALSRKQVTENTWTDVMEVIAWSMRHLANGTRPTTRHDCAEWRQSDSKRAKQAHTAPELPVRAALVEVRGDWKMFGEIFHFPKWNTSAGICWRCTCKPEEVKGNNTKHKQ